MSHIKIINNISRRLAENTDSWMMEYRIPKKFVPQPQDGHFDIENYLPFSSRPIIQPKPLFVCKICGKKNTFRRELERHTNTVHKTPCGVPGCKKLFWKPNPKFQQRHLEAVARHNADKHPACNK